MVWRRRFIGKDFVGGSPSALILGDNIFTGTTLTAIAARRCPGLRGDGFAYPVHDPERYGVAEFNASGQVISLEEKPKHPKSRYAVTGIYFYDNQVCDLQRI